MNLDDKVKWLAETEAYFKQVQSYNTTLISIGYATGFACLIYLSDKSNSRFAYLAVLFLVLSAAVFVSYEIVNHIRLARQCSNA